MMVTYTFRIVNSSLARLGKGILGGNKGGFFGVLKNDVDPRSAAECMNRLAKLSSRFMGDHGFSIGIDDVTPAEKLTQQNAEKMNQSYRQCDDFIQRYRCGLVPTSQYPCIVLPVCLLSSFVY